MNLLKKIRKRVCVFVTRKYFFAYPALIKLCDINSYRVSDTKCILNVWGTGIRGLMRGMTTVPKGNQELLVVKDKVERPPGELGVSKSIECDIISPSVL